MFVLYNVYCQTLCALAFLWLMKVEGSILLAIYLDSTARTDDARRRNTTVITDGLLQESPEGRFELGFNGKFVSTSLVDLNDYRSGHSGLKP